jgi:hypothetical protein
VNEKGPVRLCISPVINQIADRVLIAPHAPSSSLAKAAEVSIQEVFLPVNEMQNHRHGYK